MGEASHIEPRRANYYMRCFAHTMRYLGTRYKRMVGERSAVYRVAGAQFSVNGFAERMERIG